MVCLRIAAIERKSKMHSPNEGSKPKQRSYGIKRKRIYSILVISVIIQRKQKMHYKTTLQNKKEQAASYEAVEEALEEIRKPWVDSPLPSFFTCHRKLAKYSRELKVMKLTLKDYAHSGEENDPNVLKAVYDYVFLL